ncbi:hypothetical protein HYW75_06645 [Candidatus Pacearchaeota archaeon]|nr:hypothetical protein [Candidatus Pacearchaeota archaeon]
MNYNKKPLITLGRYMISYTIVGLAASLIVNIGRNIYINPLHQKETSSIIISEENKQRYLDKENNLFGIIFSIGGLAGLICGTLKGIKKLNNLENSSNEHEGKHEGCCHGHYHL